MIVWGTQIGLSLCSLQVQTARCLKTWKFNTPVVCITWCPRAALQIISACVGTRLVLLPAGVWNEKCRRLALQALKLPNAEYRDDGASAVKWVQLEGDWGGLEIQHQHLVKFVAWHAQGDYFATVSPDGHSKVGVINKCV